MNIDITTNGLHDVHDYDTATLAVTDEELVALNEELIRKQDAKDKLDYRNLFGQLTALTEGAKLWRNDTTQYQPYYCVKPEDPNEELVFKKLTTTKITVSKGQTVFVYLVRLSTVTNATHKIGLSGNWNLSGNLNAFCANDTTFPQTISTIGATNCFRESSIVSYDMLMSSESITLYQYCWYNAPLTSISIPANNITLNYWCFHTCLNLRDIYFPNATSISVSTTKWLLGNTQQVTLHFKKGLSATIINNVLKQAENAVWEYIE